MAEADPVGLLPKCGDQAELVQRRRSQVVDDSAYVVDGPGRFALELVDKALGLNRVALDQARGDIEPEGDTGEGGSETIMQVPADPTPFLLASLDQLTSRSAECIGEPDGIDRGTGRAGQVGQQRGVAGREGPVVAAGDQQPPDPLPLVLQRNSTGKQPSSRPVLAFSPPAARTAT